MGDGGEGGFGWGGGGGGGGGWGGRRSGVGGKTKDVAGVEALGIDARVGFGQSFD